MSNAHLPSEPILKEPSTGNSRCCCISSVIRVSRTKKILQWPQVTCRAQWNFVGKITDMCRIYPKRFFIYNDPVPKRRQLILTTYFANNKTGIYEDQLVRHGMVLVQRCVLYLQQKPTLLKTFLNVKYFFLKLQNGDILQ